MYTCAYAMCIHVPMHARRDPAHHHGVKHIQARSWAYRNSTPIPKSKKHGLETVTFLPPSFLYQPGGPHTMVPWCDHPYTHKHTNTHTPTHNHTPTPLHWISTIKFIYLCNAYIKQNWKIILWAQVTCTTHTETWTSKYNQNQKFKLTQLALISIA